MSMPLSKASVTGRPMGDTVDQRLYVLPNVGLVGQPWGCSQRDHLLALIAAQLEVSVVPSYSAVRRAISARPPSVMIEDVDAIVGACLVTTGGKGETLGKKMSGDRTNGRGRVQGGFA